MTSLAGKRVVIFGCGYVGTALALEALARGASVTALTRNGARAAVLREQGIDAIVADLASEDWHPRIAPAPDYALNCVSSGGGGVDGYRRSYRDGMASILDWARRGGRVGTLVYTGSTSVYPQGNGARVDETAPTPVSALSERAQLLVATESLLRDAAAETCGRWFILRLAGIYGPGRHHFIDQVRSGEASGNGQQHLNLIHRDDIVAAILACFVASPAVRNGVFNLCDDEPERKSVITAWLASRLGVPEPRFTGEPAGGRRALTPDRIIANDKAKSELGWWPRYPSFREGCTELLKSPSPPIQNTLL